MLFRSNELLNRLRKPLVSTSANISGESSPLIFRDIDERIIRSADYVVEYRREDTNKSAPSPIIKLDNNGAIKIIRS